MLIPLLSMTSQWDMMVICFIGTKGKEDSPRPLPGWQHCQVVLQEGRKGMSIHCSTLWRAIVLTQFRTLSLRSVPATSALARTSNPRAIVCLQIPYDNRIN
jgi:hypothetical protein